MIALNALADVKLVTSIREGINLGAMEFIACQQQTRHGSVPLPPTHPPTLPEPTAPHSNRRDLLYLLHQPTHPPTHPPTHLLTTQNSVLVYSEFAGCSTDFKGALIINPYDADKVAESVHVALTMSSTTKQVDKPTHPPTHPTPGG